MPQDNEYLKLEVRNVPGTYQRPLFDPVQSHAIYNVATYAIGEVKRQLKMQGATHFRTMTARNGSCIICYRGTRNPNFKK